MQLFKKKPNMAKTTILKCNEHEMLRRQLARIEGENIAILAILAITLFIVLERL